MATNSAVYNGINGVAKFDVGGSATTLASITAFSLSQTGDTIETTSMTESARTYLPGLTTATGTMELFFRDDDSAQQALFAGPGSAAATVELYPSGTTTGIKLNAEVIITSHDISVANDAAVTASVSFQVSGAVTKTNL